MPTFDNEEKNKIMEELRNIIESGAIIGITQKQLSERFNIRRQTIAIYLKKIYSSIPPEDIKQTEIKLKVMFDRVFREAQKMLQQAETPYQKEKALRLLLDCMHEFTNFLERFGLKPIQTQKINIQQQIDINLTTDIKKRAEEILIEIGE